MTGPLAAVMTGPMLAVKGAASLVTPKENEPLRTKVLRFIGVGTIVVVAAVVGIYLLTHSGGNSPNAIATQQANPQPNLGGTTTESAGPTATAKAKTKGKKNTSTAKNGATTAGDYVLSTPATAGGYPLGQDPDFLATATTTAASIMSTAASAGGGTATGSPVSAAYRLPNSQVITFVGYKGTFDPAKVITSMGSFGTSDGTYPDAKNGGQIACANTAATGSAASGAVCVWATATTLGVTEFFDVSGPEALTTSQYKGANITTQVRASVETKKS